MERLSGLDASFLYNETPSLHMHTLKYSVLDVSTVAGRLRLDRIRHELGRRLHLLPPFRRRLVEVPLGLHHPVWIEDPDFDLDYHVRRIGVPPPGGRREMDEVIGEIASWPLDRSRPLWECWVLGGCRRPRRPRAAVEAVGFLAKMHHALADGVAAAALLANVMDDVAGRGRPAAAGRAVAGRAAPVCWQLIVDALPDGGEPAPPARARWGARAAACGRCPPGARRRTCRRPCRSCDTPRTPFNGSLTPHRAFATTDLSLDDVKAVRRGLRRHRERRRARPRRRVAPRRTWPTTVERARSRRSWPACRWPPTRRRRDRG